MKKRHPLESLGWATLPEHALVRRLVNQMIREDSIRSLEYNKVAIRDAVRGTHPPYGFLQRRVAAIDTELPRQVEIIETRERRRHLQSEDTLGQPRTKEDRTTLAARSMLGLCHGYRYMDVRKATICRIQGHQVITVVLGEPGLFIRHGGNLHHFKLERYSTYYSMTDRFVYAFHGRDGLDAFLNAGCSFRFDFDTMSTILTFPDGSQESLSWTASGAYRGIHKKPEFQRPSDWPRLPK